MSLMDYGLYVLLVFAGFALLVVVMLAVEHFFDWMSNRHQSPPPLTEEQRIKDALYRYHTGQALSREDALLLGLYGRIPDDE